MITFLVLEKKSSTEWALTFRRCTLKDDGCYIVKAINNIGSDAKSWKMLVVAAKPNNILVSPCNDLPEGNQSGSINKNSEQSDDSSSLSKLKEVRNIHFQQTHIKYATFLIFKIFNVIRNFSILA